ncbi:hypothetical protein WA1_29690 [Scytonema hofmannii PCC 7110]|uniref:N-acetyltransferase domain-containing protein n=1 Tax=Scytonema hofmannii PCC 7110 TaxID=128403 RepID=A0A139X5Z4_9CYAN|nr:GNAT family N-acetyltransferase [Scytonema hofmannii]KYC40119.1 hypothetical protein WA1_29690 [Scytonema hofmannii PCC 7110]
MEKPTVRPFRPGDELGIFALYHAVFNVDISYQDWQWVYQQMPEEPAIIVVAENNEGIVGHYAVQPRPFWLHGIPCLAGLAIGTMVHPSARNLTTLVEMAHLAYDICRQRGLLFLYAFSNDVAWKVRQVVLGWQALPQLTEWEGPLLLPDSQTDTKVQIWTDFPLEFVPSLSLPNNEENQKGIGGRRTPDWLHWRFFQNPDTKYKLLVVGSLNKMQGYAVLKEYVRSGVRYGHIVDWQVPIAQASTTKHLLASALKEFAQSQVERVSCWALPLSSLFNLLPDAGLSPTGRKTNFGYFNLSLQNDAILASDNNWNIQMGDSDVY